MDTVLCKNTDTEHVRFRFGVPRIEIGFVVYRGVVSVSSAIGYILLILFSGAGDTSIMNVPSSQPETPTNDESSKRLCGTHESDRRDVIQSVRYDGKQLQHYAAIRPEFANDRLVVLVAVFENGMALEFASPCLRDDREVVIVAIENSMGCALEFASAALRNDPQIVLLALHECSHNLQHASAGLKDCYKIVMAAVRKYGGSLVFASENLQHNPDIVLAAVRQVGFALELAPVEMRTHRDIVLSAVQHEGRLLQHASAELRNDKEVVLCAVRQSGVALRYASAGLQGDREVAANAIREFGLALSYVSDELQRDREIVLFAVLTEPSAILSAAQELWSDVEIMTVVAEGYARRGGYSAHKLENVWLDDRCCELKRRLAAHVGIIQECCFVPNRNEPVLEFAFRWIVNIRLKQAHLSEASKSHSFDREVSKLLASYTDSILHQQAAEDLVALERLVSAAALSLRKSWWDMLLELGTGS